ncbi:27640_t:CDS:2, partial [Dentiscutata erythropus]
EYDDYEGSTIIKEHQEDLAKMNLKVIKNPKLAEEGLKVVKNHQEVKSKIS